MRLSWLLMFFVACDSSAPSAPAAPTGAVAKLAAARCEMLERCDIVEDGMEWWLLAKTAASCTSGMARLGDGPVLAAGLAAGEIIVDEAKLESCLAEIKSSCSLVGGGACRSAFSGKRELGAICVNDYECAGDAYCADDDGCSRCTARLPLGADCSDSRACSGASGDSTCTNVCVPVRLAPSDDGFCGENHDQTDPTIAEFQTCPADQVCTLYGCTNVGRNSLGESCGDSDEGYEGGHDFCARDTVCGDDERCRKPVLAQRAGDACSDEVACNLFN